MRPLRAVEEVFLLRLCGFGGAGVGVRVGDSGSSAVGAYPEGMPDGAEGGEGCCGEDVAGVAIRKVSVWAEGDNMCMRNGGRGGWGGGGVVWGEGEGKWYLPVFLG